MLTDDHGTSSRSIKKGFQQKVRVKPQTFPSPALLNQQTTVPQTATPLATPNAAPTTTTTTNTTTTNTNTNTHPADPSPTSFERYKEIVFQLASKHCLRYSSDQVRCIYCETVIRPHHGLLITHFAGCEAARTNAKFPPTLFSGLSRFVGLGSETLETSSAKRADMHLARYLLSTGTSINMVRHSSLKTMFKILNHHTFSPEQFRDKIMYKHAEQSEGEMVQYFRNANHLTIAVENITTELRRDNSCVYRVSATRRDGYSFTVSLIKLEADYVTNENLWKSFNGIFWRLGISKASVLVTDSTDVLVEFSKKLEANPTMMSGFTCFSMGLAHLCTSIFKSEMVQELMSMYTNLARELMANKAMQSALSHLSEEVGDFASGGRAKSHLYVNRFLGLFEITSTLNSHATTIQKVSERGLSVELREFCHSLGFWQNLQDLVHLLSPVAAAIKKCQTSPVFLSDAYVFAVRILTAFGEKKDTWIGRLLSDNVDNCLEFLRSEYLQHEAFNQAILLDTRYKSPYITPEGIISLTNRFVAKQKGDSAYRKALCNEMLDFVSASNRPPQNLNDDPLKFWGENKKYTYLPKLALAVFRIIANPLSPARKYASMGWLHSPGAKEVPQSDLGIFMNTFLYLNWDDLCNEPERVLATTAYNNVSGEELERIQEDAATEAVENQDILISEYAREFDERLYLCSTFKENIARQVDEEKLGHLWSKRTISYL